MFSDLFANSTTSLVRDIFVADYKASLQGNWGSVYLDNNKKNNENKIDSNANIVKGQGRNIENSIDVDF